MYIEQLERDLLKQGGQQTIDHIYKVAELMKKFALAINEDADAWYYGGFLHDAGKFYVPKCILESTNRLSAQEYKCVRKHVDAGIGLIKAIYGLSDEKKKTAIDCADYHHAWYNGKEYSVSEKGGYSRTNAVKLSGNQIPLAARCCAICDVYDAITSKRSYSDAQSSEKAIKILINEAKEGHFDYVLTCKFINKVLGVDLKNYKELLVAWRHK